MTALLTDEQPSLLLIHGAIPLVPAVSAHLGSDAVSTGCALALLLVVTVASTATATDVRGLLALAHAWSTLAHLNTSAARRPTLCISGLPPPYGRIYRCSKSIETSPPVDSICKSGSAKCSLPVTKANSNPNTSPIAASIAEKPDSRITPPLRISSNEPSY